MTSIWVIGAKGMLGQDVCATLQTGGYNLSLTDKEVDICNVSALIEHGSSFFNRPHSADGVRWIINCSAYTAVDQAEDEPEVAASINTRGVANIAQVAKELDATVIHISTDYVFGGTLSNGTDQAPFTENDPTMPLSVYGRTKLEGEKALVETCNKFFILRTAWLYGFHGKNFIEVMLKLFSERELVSVVNDQFGAPTWSLDLAQCIKKIIESGSEDFGIYHCAASGITTWYDYAVFTYKKSKALGLLKNESPVKIVPVDTTQFPTKAYRPAWSVLSVQKLYEKFHIKMPFWKESVSQYLEKRTR